jgi:hypothetical protein
MMQDEEPVMQLWICSATHIFMRDAQLAPELPNGQLHSPF